MYMYKCIKDFEDYFLWKKILQNEDYSCIIRIFKNSKNVFISTHLKAGKLFHNIDIVHSLAFCLIYYLL